jgi:NADH-quinone oxidoreductase subunit C
MTRDEVLRKLKERFAEGILTLADKSPRRVYVDVDPGILTGICGFLFRDLGARFNTASAVDGRTSIEILYHFILEPINLLISVRVRLDRSSPAVESLTPFMAAADYVEREIHELFGVDFHGHPDLRRLLLPEQWPEGVHPLRRDYVEWDPTAVRDRGVR